MLFQLKWKAIYIRRWWWWVLEPLWFPGDHTSPSFDRLWGARHLRFADTLTIMVNFPEWLSLKWSTSVISEVRIPPTPPQKSQVTTLSAILVVLNELFFIIYLEKPQPASTKTTLEHTLNADTNATLFSRAEVKEFRFFLGTQRSISVKCTVQKSVQISQRVVSLILICLLKIRGSENTPPPRLPGIFVPM